MSTQARLWPASMLAQARYPAPTHWLRQPISNLPGLQRHIVLPLAALSLLLPAWHMKHPLSYSLRALELPLLIGLPVLGLLAGARLSGLCRGILLSVLLSVLWHEIDFRLQQTIVLNAPPAAQAVGAHLIVGYDNVPEVRDLAAKGLIGGIYLTRRNIRGRSMTALAEEIAALQAVRQRAELPPLIVAADQEGGAVAHLSPLLERLPPLGLLANGEDGEDLAAAHAYGERQARGLAALGITLNLGPVVDLRPATPRRPDRFSNIAARALGSEPGRVGRIAGAYLDGLAEHGVRGTLKHFPGLGRIDTDTHLHPARLDLPPTQLEADWHPFKLLSPRPESVMMLGHVTLSALDPTHAASHSAIVADGLLRQTWGYEGLLITDDLNMGAVYRRGIGQVTTEALTAGVDLILISYDPRQVYRALYSAANALSDGSLPAAILNISATRLARYRHPPSPTVDRPNSPKIRQQV